ncbi:MAG: PilZ domain-containing protein [Clostridiales bacterium]|nr:PilZ domain-containing protein [Clostridiales bacterium]
MRLYKGKLVTIQHYSLSHLFSGQIVEASGDGAKIKLVSRSVIRNLKEHDPVVLGIDQDEQLLIAGSNIRALDKNDDVMELQLDKEVKEFNRRLYERFPVSLYSDIFSYRTGKKHFSTIKDISENGMRIYTDTELSVNEDLEVSIYFSRSVIFLRCVVVREAKLQGYSDYGLMIKHDSASTLNTMREFIRTIKQPHENYLNKII